MASTPYLSTVVTSRNDNHGGSMQRRMQVFIDCWFERVVKFDLDVELILVEWNPPQDRPPLSEALDWSKQRGRGTVRIITVPPETHVRFPHAERLPLNQFIAKNVGIRRARGQFVLATNVDIILSYELCEFLAKQNLDTNVVYRNDRYDIADSILKAPPGTDSESFCNTNIIRINGPTWTVDLRDGRIFHRFLSNRFRTISKNFFRAGHFARLLARSGRLATALTGVARGSMPQGGKEAWRMLGSLWREAGQHPDLFRKPINAHVNACGDFTLMSRDVWDKVHGHPEYDGYSMHVDSLLLLTVLAKQAAREKILPYPMRHFHIDHSSSHSGYTPDTESKLFARLAAQKIPYLTWDEVERYMTVIELHPDQASFNDAGWGLMDTDFPETVF